MSLITTDGLAVLAFACAALTLQTVRLRRSRHTFFDGGILISICLLIAAALPILSRLPWAELADQATHQAVAAIHLLEVTYVILTL